MSNTNLERKIFVSFFNVCMSTYSQVVFFSNEFNSSSIAPRNPSQNKDFFACKSVLGAINSGGGSTIFPSCAFLPSLKNPGGGRSRFEIVGVKFSGCGKIFANGSGKIFAGGAVGGDLFVFGLVSLQPGR